MNSTIWNGFQNIGDDLILKAEETAFKAHFSKKRPIFSYIAIAASILFIFSLSIKFLYMTKSENNDMGFLETGKDDFAESQGRYFIEKETKEFIYILSLEKDSYKVSEEINLKLSCTTKDNIISSKDVPIEFFVKDYNIVIDGEEKNFLFASSVNGKISFEIDVSLIPKKPSKAGKVNLDIFLYVGGNLEDEGLYPEHEPQNPIERISFGIPISIFED